MEIVWTSGPGCLLGEEFWEGHSGVIVSLGLEIVIVKVSCLNRKECWHGETNSDYDLRLNVFFKQPQLFCILEVLLKMEELYPTRSIFVFSFLFYVN